MRGGRDCVLYTAIPLITPLPAHRGEGQCSSVLPNQEDARFTNRIKIRRRGCFRTGIAWVNLRHTHFLTITCPGNSTTPAAGRQGRISKGAAIFFPGIPSCGFLQPVFSTPFLFILNRETGELLLHSLRGFSSIFPPWYLHSA